MGLRLSIGGGRDMVAVEFDQRRLRIVKFTQSGGSPQLAAVRSVTPDEPIDTNDAAALGERLAKVLSDLGLSASRVVMNVRRDEVVLRPLSLPPGAPDAELAGMVRYQLGKELPFPASEAVVDHVVTDHYQVDDAAGADGRTVLAAAVRAEVVEFYRLVAAAAGLRLVRLGFRPLAIGRCVARCVRRQAGECVAVVNLTADQTEIDVFIDGGLAFSRSVPIGMPERTMWPDQRRPAVDAAVREVMLSVQSFQAVHAGGGVDAVLVSGDTGLEEDLVAALSPKISGACELFTPARALGLSGESSASAHAALLGVALTDPAGAAETYDFLNPKRPAAKRNPKRDKMAAAGVVAMLVAAALIGSGWWYLNGLAAESSALSEDLGSVDRDARATRKLVSRVKTIDAWQEDSVDWLGHWAQLSRALPSPTEAYVRNLTTRDDGTITFAVRAKSRETIEQVQKQLGALEGYKVSPVRMPSSTNDPVNLEYSYESLIQVQTDRRIGPELSDQPVERPSDDGSAELLPKRLTSRSHRGRS